MSSVRDLFVSIDFSNVDFKTLTKLDHKVDDVERSLNSMGHEIDGATAEFAMMGVSGATALNSIDGNAGGAERAINHMGDEVVKTTAELALMGAVGTAALAGVDGKADDVKKSIGDMGGGFGNLTSAIWRWGFGGVAAASAIVAASAPVLLAVGGLTASLSTATLGAAAFGAVAIPMMTKLFESSTKVDQLQQKINNASSAKERIKAEGQLAALYDSMSKSQKGALKGLQEFKKFFVGFSKQFENPVFDAFSQGLDLVKKIMVGLGPTIGNVSGVINKLLTEMNTSIDGGGMKSFFDWLSTNGANSLYNFAHIAGNTMSGVISLIQAFTPAGKDMETGLLSLTDKFKTWADGIGNSTAFQNFVTYAQQNGPTLLGIISDIWDIFKKLVTDLAPLGTTVLSGIKDFTGYINDNWPAVKETAIALSVGFGVLTLGLGAVTLATWGFTAALLANPITWVVVGIAALVGAVVYLWRNWDLVKTKTIEVWNAMGPLGNVILSLLGPIGTLIRAGISLAQNWGTIKSAAVSAWNGAASVITQSINSITSQINGLIGLINHIPGVKVPKIPTVYVPASKPTGVADFRKLDGSHAAGLASVPWDNYNALLHKNESVLTAGQSNVLREAGILSKNGQSQQSKPQLNMSQGVAPTAAVASATPGNNTPVFSPNITVHVNGGDSNSQTTAQQIAEEVRRETEVFWQQMLLKQA